MTIRRKLNLLFSQLCYFSSVTGKITKFHFLLENYFLLSFGASGYSASAILVSKVIEEKRRYEVTEVYLDTYVHTEKMLIYRIVDV